MGVALSHDLLRVSLCCSWLLCCRQTLFANASKCHFYCNKVRAPQCWVCPPPAPSPHAAGLRLARQGQQIDTFTVTYTFTVIRVSFTVTAVSFSVLEVMCLVRTSCHIYTTTTGPPQAPHILCIGHVGMYHVEPAPACVRLLPCTPYAV